MDSIFADAAAPTAQELLLSMSIADRQACSELSAALDYHSDEAMIEELLRISNSYDPNNIYDLDGDGHLTSSDALLVINFLNGTIQYAYEYSEMDGDGDGKIDKDDAVAYADCAIDVIAQLVNEGAFITHMHTTNSYSPQAITFVKYSATTGNYLSYYQLNPATMTSNNEPSAEASESDRVIAQDRGSDDMKKVNTRMVNENIIYNGPQSTNVYPKGIAKIETYTGQNLDIAAFGSGFVIDSHVIATAGNLVFNKLCGTLYGNCTVKNKIIRLFAQNGNVLTNITITPVEYHVPYEFIASTVPDGYDFALITVAEDLSNYKSLSLGMPFLEYITSGANVYNSGTPGLIGNTVVNDFNNLHRIVTASGNIFRFNQNDPLNLIVGAHCPPVASGGPLYVPDNEAVLSVVTVGAGSYGEDLGGTRIRSEMFKFYYNNPYISY